MPKNFLLSETRSVLFYVFLAAVTTITLIISFEGVQYWIHPAPFHLFPVLLSGGCVVLAISIGTYFLVQRELSILKKSNLIAQRLRESNERYVKLVLHIPGMAFQLQRDAEGHFSVLFATDGIKNIFGCAPNDATEDIQAILRVVHPEDVARVLESLNQSAQYGTLWQQEFRLIIPGQEEKWVLGQSTPETLPDRSTIWYGHVSDITRHKHIQDEQVRLQKLEQDEHVRIQRLESLGVLAGGIAHDFNNILTGILGNASIAESLVENTKLEKFLVQIMKGVERATGLTQQFLAFAKGGIPSLEKVSLGALIRDSAEFFLGESSKSKCVLDIPDNLWFVHADSMQISQVIQNLILNANQAMPEGGLIKISARNVEDPKETGLRGHYIHISVTDSGVGIPEKDKERVFEPYFTTKAEGTGSGLGLAVVYRIIEKHRGKIGFSSLLGEGTTFNVYIPAIFENSIEYTPAKEDTIISRPLKILVMDDDPMLQEALLGMLERLGHSVVITTEGASAIQEFVNAENAQAPFDLVILDLTIPGGMGGEDTLHALLEIQPNLVSIISSGYADRIPVGFNAALPKPYGMRSLKKAIADALSSQNPT